MRRPHRQLLYLAVAACVLLTAPATASATFHLMQVREVYAGSSAHPDSQYVELQAWAGGQNFVGGHVLRTYNAAGAVTATSTFAGDGANGANQSTLLLATPAAEAEFGVNADAALSGSLSPSGGAVCWESIDCVAWGGFSGAGLLPSPVGSPVAAAGIPPGMAIRRRIDRVCPTSLDFGDDTDSSAADFEAVFPQPRPNSAPPTETLCNPPGAGGGGGAGTGAGPPRTTLRRKPPKRTTDRTPTFRFSADEAGVRFQCKLDRKPFRGCRSAFTTKRLSFGAHTFRVRAIDSDGTADPTPASYRFRVIRG